MAQYDPELELLGDDVPLDDFLFSSADHTFKTAPVVTEDAYNVLGHDVIPQRAVYGRIVSQRVHGCPERVGSQKLYINTNAPFSALVCGVQVSRHFPSLAFAAYISLRQGSGKSHSTSVLLESCLMSDDRIGTLPEPLSGLVYVVYLPYAYPTTDLR